MTPLYILSLLVICADAAWPAAAAKHLAIHHHQRQQRGAPVPVPVTTSTSITTYTVMTPSPSATPVAVTSLSQVVTSYIPQMTICAIPSPSSSTFSRWMNSSNALALVPRTASASLECTTQYSSTVLTVCATTLQGLGSTVAVTECGQQVTFSSQYGYSLVPASTVTASTVTVVSDSTIAVETTITSPPSIATITSYYIAPWQALTTLLLVLNITERICSTATPNVTTTSDSLTTPSPSLQCIDIYEARSTTTTTSTSSITSTIDFSTSLPTGQKIVIVGPITSSMKEEEMQFVLKTELVLPTVVEKEVVSVSTVKAVSGTSTMSVWPAFAMVEGKEKMRGGESTSTSTTTFRTTSYVTRTITLTTTIPPSKATSAVS